jgi:hypothetical protein
MWLCTRSYAMNLFLVIAFVAMLAVFSLDLRQKRRNHTKH